MKVFTVKWWKSLSVRGEFSSREVKETRRPSEKVFCIVSAHLSTIQIHAWCKFLDGYLLTLKVNAIFSQTHIFLDSIKLSILLSVNKMKLASKCKCLNLVDTFFFFLNHILYNMNNILSCIMWEHVAKIQMSHGSRTRLFFSSFVSWFVCKCLNNSTVYL